MDWPLTNEDGKLRTFGRFKSILDKNRLRDLGFDIPRGKVKPQEAAVLDKAEEEMTSTSDIAKVDNIGLQEITGNASRSTENLIVQLEGESLKDFPMLWGLNKQPRSI